MSYGVTPQGFIKKTEDVILSEREAKARELFGADVDLSIYSPIGILNRLEAEREANQWQDLEDEYYDHWIDTAEGVDLDRLIVLRGFNRIDALQSIVTLTFTGTDTTSIPSGTVCQTAQGIQFITTETVAISGTTADATARAVEAGLNGNVPSDTITIIVTPVAGITAVNNAAAATQGRDQETDPELRARYKDPASEGGSSAVAMQNLFRQLDGVVTAIVVENNTDLDVGIMEPHSMRAIIEGGDTDDIFGVFLSHKPAGIETIGSQVASGTDPAGITRSFNYDLPTNVNIYTDVDFTIDETAYGDTAANWLIEFGDRAKENVIEVIGGVFDGTTYAGGGIGIDVEAWKISANMLDLPYVTGVIVVKVAKTASPTLDRVDLDIDERGQTDTAKITLSAVAL
jgi:uncharacterized phage protein gp47/JayE